MRHDRNDPSDPVGGVGQIGHVERAGEAVAVGDRAGIVEWTNSAWRRITGWALEDVVGKPVGHLLDSVGLEPEFLEFIQSRFLAGMRASVEVPIETPEGRVVHIHLDVEPIRDESGDIGHFVAVATDVTARRQSELALERIRQEQAHRGPDGDDEVSRDRLVAAEALAARSLDTLRRIEQLCLEIERTTAIGLLDEFGVRSVRERATAAVDAAIELIERAGAEATSHRPVDLGEIVSRSLRRARQTLPDRAQFDVVLDPALPPVRADEKEVAAAIARLIGAGLRALEENWDTLSITTGITQPGQPLVSTVHSQSFPGPLRDDAARCFVEIHDTGPTLPPEQLRRLRGSLLPTPRSPRIAELLEIRARLRDSGVEMDVSSTPGCGTRVLLLLPICA
jgi:PAS domain S-box-containing protein